MLLIIFVCRGERERGFLIYQSRERSEATQKQNYKIYPQSASLKTFNTLTRWHPMNQCRSASC